MRICIASWAGVLALPFLVTACDQPSRTANARDTASVARVDKQAEERAIRALEQQWREALTAKDSATVRQFYAEGGYYLPQGSNGYQGPEQVATRWAGEFSGRKFELEREPKKIEVADAGDMAYEVGTYKVSWDKPKQGKGAGNYVTVWKKVGGEWKTAAYIWNRGEEK